MLNYTDDIIQGKKFILYYAKEEKDLQVYLGDGSAYPVPNTKENKAKILRQMESQVENVDDFKEKTKKSKKKNYHLARFYGCLIGCSLISLISNFSLLTGVLFLTFTLRGITKEILYKKDSKLLEDIEKNQLFVKNKRRINDFLEHENNEVYEESINLVEAQNEQALTINDVHDLTYKDISEIVDNIDRDEYFGIERPKTLTKRYTPKSMNNRK